MLFGLMIGIGLTFTVVLGTHWFERVRTVQILTNTTSGSQQSAVGPALDQAQVDAANMIRHDPVGRSPASIQADQARVDAENMIRHDPVGQSPASIEAIQARVDAENMIRHDPPLPASNQ
jgi:hypothetical protein